MFVCLSAYLNSLGNFRGDMSTLLFCSRQKQMYFIEFTYSSLIQTELKRKLKKKIKKSLVIFLKSFTLDLSDSFPIIAFTCKEAGDEMSETGTQIDCKRRFSLCCV